MKIKSKIRLLARVAFLLLLIALGYSPFIVNAFFSIGIQDNFSAANRVWDNEGCAWSLIFVIFYFIAVAISVSMFDKNRIISLTTIIFAVFGITLDLLEVAFGGLRPADIGDSSGLQLLGFWTLGGGWIAGFFIIPLLATYLLLLTIEKFCPK